MAAELDLGRPPSVALIRSAADWIVCHRHLAALAAAAVGLLIVFLTGVSVVATEESATVTRFGKLIEDRVGPGLHLWLPRGIDVVHKVKTGSVFRLQVRGDFIPGGPVPLLELITGDENIIETDVVVQYQVTTPGDFLFSVDDPTSLLAQAVRAALVRTVAAMQVDEVLTSGKALVQNTARAEAQAMLDRYNAGVSLLAVSLQSVNPPGEAVSAFHAVSDAKAQAAQAINEAEGNREQMLSNARGMASKAVQEAMAQADARVHRARGATERFAQVLARAKRTPEQNQNRVVSQHDQGGLAASADRVACARRAAGHRPESHRKAEAGWRAPMTCGLAGLISRGHAGSTMPSRMLSSPGVFAIGYNSEAS
jgi:membrane protease subunit HflK